MWATKSFVPPQNNILGHAGTSVCFCVCFCGVGWRRVWPHGCRSRCDLSLSAKDCSTHPEEEDEENCAAGLRGRGDCSGEIETWPPPPPPPRRPRRSLHRPVWHITHSEKSELSKALPSVIDAFWDPPLDWNRKIIRKIGLTHLTQESNFSFIWCCQFSSQCLIYLTYLHLNHLQFHQQSSGSFLCSLLCHHQQCLGPIRLMCLSVLFSDDPCKSMPPWWDLIATLFNFPVMHTTSNIFI